MIKSSYHPRRPAVLILLLCAAASLLTRHHVASRPAPLLAPLADLAIANLQAPAQAQANSTLIYTIVVTNFGPDIAESVTLSDMLPVETSFVSCQSTAGGVCGGTGNNRTVSFTSLAPGASAIITLTATVNCAVSDGEGPIYWGGTVI